MMFLIRDPLL